MKNQGKLSDDIKIQGNIPTSGWVLVQGNSVTQYSLIIDGYRVSEIRNIDETTTTKTVVKVDDNTELLDQPNFYISNPNVVYLDPTDLSKTCTESDSVSTTETKSGCMKWYVYYNDGYDAKLLLDHNTTARLAFSDTSASTETMLDEIKSRLAYDTWNNSEHPWKIEKNNISVIRADEIAKIVRKENWVSTSASNSFFFDGLGVSKTATYTSSLRNPYAWLYNNTYKCKSDDIDYGCTEEDTLSYDTNKLTNNEWSKITSKLPIYGYRTSSYKDHTTVFVVSRSGTLSYEDNSKTGYGIRPVIKVSSSLVQ